MQDLRLAFRALRTTPIVTAVAVLSLALGIGANTAIFSLVDSLILRTLPVADPQHLVILSGRRNSGVRPAFSYVTYDHIRRHRQGFDGTLAFSDCCEQMTLSLGGQGHPVDSFFVSGDFFGTLGVSSLIGRLLIPADDVPGGGADGPVAVISYTLWQERFGGAVSVIGAPVTIERVAVTIVGVTPPDFLGVEVGRTFDLILPIQTESQIQPSIAFDDHVGWLNIMLRLKPGVSLESATAALRAVQPQVRAGSLPKQFPSTFLREPFVLESAGTGTSTLREQFERPLAAILVVVAFVLLIACANIANLLSARGAARRHELSVRLALGASRRRLARQLLAESLVLAGVGAILGLVFAGWASRTIAAQLSTSITPVALNLSLDWRVLAFTAAMMVATAMVFGMVPALRATRVAARDALREHGRVLGDAGGVGGRWSSGLIVAQVALSLILVVAAGLFVQTFERLAHAPLGLDRDRVLMVTITAPTVPAADRNLVYHQLVKAAASVPGVAHAGGSLNPPIAGSLVGDIVVTEPGVAPRPDAEVVSQYTSITPGTLASYGTPIRAGRDVDDRDTDAAPKVMLVNEALVGRFFPGRSLIGAPLALTFRSGQSGDVPLGTYTVVGVTGDAAYRSIRTPMRPTIYVPMAQRGGSPILHNNFYISVRAASGSPALLTRNVAAALTAVNRDLAMTFSPLATLVDESLAQDRLVAMLSGFFGALALLLAGLGLYGVTAFAVARRRTEIGIRMALGAPPASVMKLVLARVALLVGIGIIIGAVGSLWASQFVASLIYGLAPRDPVTLIGAAITLVVVGAVAGWLPAWSASRIDPSEVLRES
jgi:putative ABC transport system permease protein